MISDILEYWWWDNIVLANMYFIVDVAKGKDINNEEDETITSSPVRHW